MLSVRSGIRNVATVVAVLLLFPIVSEFAVELARENGWYDQPTDRVAAAMKFVSDLATKGWFINTAIATTAFAAGMWFDLSLRKIMRPLMVRSTKAGSTTDSAPLILLKQEDFVVKHILIDGHHFVSCKFRNCVVEYNGGDYDITTCEIKKSTLRFVTRNHTIMSSMKIFQAIGLTQGESKIIELTQEDMDQRSF